MFRPSKDQLDRANQCIGDSLPLPPGYRICVKRLESDNGLKAAEKEKFKFLAATDFVANTGAQQEKEDRGSHFGILCHVGKNAFEGDYHCGEKPKEGDVVVMVKYAGLGQEFPPRSGDFYHFCNDEDVMGIYGLNVLDGDQSDG